MSNEMEEDWFAPEVKTEPTPQPAPAPTKPHKIGPNAPTAPAAKTTNEKSVEEKPTSTNNGQEEPNEDWFAKPPTKKPKATPKKNLPPEEVTPPPLKTAPSKDLPAELSAKEEDPDHWFAKVPENPTDSGLTLVKSQPRKESYMYGYISKVMSTRGRMKILNLLT